MHSDSKKRRSFLALLFTAGDAGRSEKNMTTISYQPFDDLIGSLRADGFNQQADSLDYLLHKVAWTTGSELIGELGQKIKEIRKQDFCRLSAETKNNMKEGMDMVKIVWPDFPEN